MNNLSHIANALGKKNSEEKEHADKVIPRTAAMNKLSGPKDPLAKVTGSQAGHPQPAERIAVLKISAISEKTAIKYTVSMVTVYFFPCVTWSLSETPPLSSQQMP